jgi:NCS1 family nucleobase:cation symporter-1
MLVARKQIRLEQQVRGACTGADGNVARAPLVAGQRRPAFGYSRTGDYAMAHDHAPAPAAGPPEFIVETHSIDFIPDSARHGSARGLFPMWFGANCMIVTISTGSLAVVSGFSLFWAGVALIIGLLIGGVFMACHSAQGPHLGLPQMIQSRAQFGFYGANLPLLIVVLMYLGFFASGGVLGGEAAAGLLHVPLGAGIVVVSVANTVLVLLGYRVIHLFERALTVLCVVTFVAFSVALLISAPPAQATAGTAHAGFRTAPFVLTVALAAIYLISYAPYVADYSRYLPRTTAIAPTFWYTYAGVVISGIWMMLLGSVLQERYPGLDVVGQIQHVAGAWGRPFEMAVLLVIALGVVGINGLNIYGAFMSSLTMVTSYLRHWRASFALRVWFIVPIAALGTYGAFLEKDSYLNSYQNFLSFLLYFLVPWTAVNLADFYLVRHGSYDVADMFSPRGRYGRFNKAGMTAYLTGCLAQVPFANVAFYEGPLARALGGSDISWIAGILVSGACYLALVRIWPQTPPAARSDYAAPARAGLPVRPGEP